MLNLSGLTSWLTGVGLPLVVLAIGLIVVLRSHGGDHASAMKTIGVALLGLIVVGLAISGQAPAVGKYLLTLVGIG